MSVSDWFSSKIAAPTDYLPPRAAPTIQVTEVPPETDNEVAVAEPVACSADLVVSLAARNFVVLTGPAGTGKSRSALRLAQALEVMAAQEGAEFENTFSLIPVGADWTDSRPLLGYRNPFGKPRKNEKGEVTNETYDVPDALGLVLRAADPQRAEIPHFLILDEMNLSHVERYFSTFLSLIEARRTAVDPSRLSMLPPETMRLISEVLMDADATSLETGAAIRLDQGGRGLIPPHGLFVVGTVNVDETTYMFSPKVLDRAHVIELLPPKPGLYIEGTVIEEESIQPNVARRILAEAMEIHRARELDRKAPNEIMANAADRFGIPEEIAPLITASASRLLDGAFKLLEPVGFGFGYRVVHEVFIYLFFWFHARWIAYGGGEVYKQWPTALDKAFLQKVLPKIHGNRRQLGSSLLALAAFLQGNDRSGQPAAAYQNAEGPEVGIDESERLRLEVASQMSLSRQKLQRMNDRLAATGYVSFVQ